MQFGGGPLSLGKQEVPRTVLVAVMVVGTLVTVVATAKVEVAIEVEVLIQVEMRV